MGNPKGKNGWGIKEYPPDEILKETLMKYSQRGNLTREDRCVRLAKDLNLSIRPSKLSEIEKRLEIPSVRRNVLPKEVAAQAIIDEVEKDITGGNGPNYIKSKLQQSGIKVPRDAIRKVMHAHFPDGFDKRYPGKNKSQIHRRALTAIGPYHEVSSDGHEKLAASALRMGEGVGLPIYAFKDKWSVTLLSLDVVPDCRTAGAVGHLYLDLLESIGGIPLQSTTDLGSEVGWLHSIQAFFREEFSNIDTDVFKSSALVKSVHNTVIEAFWRWLRDKTGINMKIVILRGKTDGIFDSTVPYHANLFRWIFPPLVQGELDCFRTWWNNHQIRGQAEKEMPSGHVPIDALEHPELLGGMSCLIPIPPGALSEMRTVLDEEVGTRESFLRWVSPEFSACAEEVHASLGSPIITFENCWKIFRQMADVMDTWNNENEDM